MTQTFQFTVPSGVRPGQVIQVNTPNGSKVNVKIPNGVFPGQKMKVRVASENNPSKQNVTSHQNTGAGSKYMKTLVPNGVKGGQKLAINTPDGRKIIAKLPHTVFPNQELVINIETGLFETNKADNINSGQKLLVTVPANIGNNTTLGAKTTDGRTIYVKLPQGARPGHKLVIDVETGQILEHQKPQVQNNVSAINYASQSYSSPVNLKVFPSFVNFQTKRLQTLPLGTRKADTNMRNVRSSGRKKALLVGINYPGTRAALRGCINDVIQMKEFLLSKGFRNTPETMVCLVDNSRDSKFMPTKNNIIKGLQWLAEGASPGDTLFFHYSGHGAQESDKSGRESDGLNETLVPCDFEKRGAGMISDDQIWDIICAPLPSGCRLYSLMDCCHSGTGLDLSFSFNGRKWSCEVNPNLCEGDVIMFSGCKDHQTSADAWNHDMKAAGGAMTTSFINAQRRNPGATLDSFLHNVKKDIKKRGFTQVPQLTSSQQWDPRQRTLGFDEGIVSNRNEHIGKVKTQHFKPGKPNMGNSPLGPLLLAAGYAVLLGPSAGLDMLKQLGEAGEIDPGEVAQGAVKVAKGVFGFVKEMF